jgi:hypothetical protein
MADVVLRGAVRDASGTALRDVRVQVFEAGQLVGRTTTTSDGTFTLTVGAAPVRPSSNHDRSLDLWVLSPDASRWIDERLLVVFDDAKREDPLIPRCTPIVTLLGGAASVDVMMKSPEERRTEIAKSRCLEARAGG